MPNLNGRRAFTGTGVWIDGKLMMQGTISCSYDRCRSSTYLDDSTRYELNHDDKLIYSLPPAEQHVARAALEEREKARASAFDAAPLPAGWFILETSSGKRYALCSPRCIRLFAKRFEV